MPVSTRHQPINVYTSDASFLPNIATIIHEHAEEDPEAIAYLVPNEQHTDWLPLSWGRWSSFLAELEGKYMSRFKSVLADRPTSNRPVVAVLVSPSQDFFGPFFALCGVGFCAMPVNPYLPASTIAEILIKANAEVIISGGLVAHVGQEAIDEVGSRLNHKIELHIMPAEDMMVRQAAPDRLGKKPLYTEGELQEIKTRTKAIEPAVPVYLMHSTGSTGSPKIIKWMNEAVYAQIRRNVTLEGFMNPNRRGRMGLLGLGVDSVLPELNSLAAGWPVFISKEPFAIAPIGIVLKVMFLGAGWPVVLPLFRSTQFEISSLLENLVRSHTQEYSVYSADMANIVAYLDTPAKSEKERASKERYLNYLRALGPLPCGGSRVDRWVMKKAIRLGIQIQVTLGTTEGGFVMGSIPSLLKDAWGNVVDASEHMLDLALGMKPFPDTPLIFDLAEGETSTFGQPVYEMSLDTRDLAFSDPALANDGFKWRTRDLFRKLEVPLPDGKVVDLWVYENRRDDMLMLGNGENIQPIAIETALHTALKNASAPHCEVLIVGTSRPVPAILVEFGPGQPPTLKEEEVTRKALEDALPALNETLPRFFPLRKEMICFLQGEEHFFRTVKGNVHRGKTEYLLVSKLDKLYGVKK